MKECESIRFLREYFPKVTAIESGAYRWQEELFRKFVAGEWPQDVCLPTGAGKTSVIVLWLLALIWCSMSDSRARRVPRRLVWVVNRRVVVDQATNEAEQIRNTIENAVELDVLRHALAQLSVCGGFAISTLRGECADNGDWRLDPSRPALIVGTVDMVGSRLLFRGYGDSKYFRPQHAGLLGYDSAIVNDESHLTPAFGALLERVAHFQSGTAFRFMRLSATPLGEQPQWPTSIDDDAEERAEFRARFAAPKTLFLHPVKKSEIERQMVRFAEEDGPARRVVLFLRSPERAADIAERLEESAAGRVALLTGTMRGWERDQLAGRPIAGKATEANEHVQETAFRIFLKKESPTQRYHLIATSAAEVGVNLTSDLLITDLDTADHLLQRFGRLNRFGEGAGVARLVFAEPMDQQDARKAATLRYLKTLANEDGAIDISCRRIFCDPPPAESLSEPPLIAHLDERLIDLWSQTSLPNSPAVPPVADWLHGKQDGDVPETAVCWREDTTLLTNESVTVEELEGVFDRFPVLAAERLREPTKAIREKLQALEKSEDEQPPQERRRALCIRGDGSVGIYSLGELARDVRLEDATLVLPPGCGVLIRGMFRADGDHSGPYDVADRVITGDPQRARFVGQRVSGEMVWKRLGADGKTLTRSLEELEEHTGLRAVAEIELDDEGTCLVYMRRRSRPPSLKPAYLGAHVAAVSRCACAIAEKVGCAHMIETFSLAAMWHDEGKNSDIWQRAAGRSAEEPALAKPKKPFPPRLLSGFRHEFASLRQAEAAGLADDLALHLVAAHHGWARPHFPPRALDRTAVAASGETALTAVQRFGRLQREYGPWGLAYLEALFKAADGWVSDQEKEQPSYA